MSIYKPTHSPLLHSQKRRIGSKSLSRILIPCIVPKLRNNLAVHHSQKQINVITSFNFIITKHKPLANPWQECCYPHPAQNINKISICEPKVNSLMPLKVKIEYGKKRNKSVLRSKNFCIQKSLKTRKSSISGWV